MATGDDQEYYEDDAPRRGGRDGRRRRGGCLVLVLAAVLVIGALVAAGLYLTSIGRSFDQQSRKFDESFPTEENRPEDDDATNILLLGSDSGGGSGESEDLPMVPNSGRSDTIMLIHIPADGDDVQLMSIMRDTWVEIPGHGEHKVNAALSLGGVPLTVETVESMFDVRVDHVAAIDLEGFTGLVDTLDGVTVDSPTAFSTDDYSFTEGPQELDSDQAMQFVRERYTFEDGDFQRVRNQQAFMTGVMDEVLTPSNLANPARAQDLVDDLAPYITVDDTLGSWQLTQMGWNLRSVRSGDVTMFTLPVEGLGRSGDGQSILIRDDRAIEEIGAAMREGELAEYVEDNDL